MESSAYTPCDPARVAYQVYATAFAGVSLDTMFDYATTGIKHLRLRAAANHHVDTRLTSVSNCIYGKFLVITIEVGNSYSMIKGLEPSDLKKLRQLVSYQPPYNPTSRFGTPPKRPLVDKRGEFPTGLLPRVLSFLQDQSLLFSIRELRIKPKPQKGLFNLSLGVTPHAFQIDAVKASLEHSRGILSATTGSGKSVILALLVQALQVPTLIVVPNLTLKTQLTESFKAWFGDLRNITIENIDSNNLNSVKNYGAILIDECHHTAAATYRKLNKKQWSGIFYRFCLTATPFRSKDEEQILFESVAGEVIYELGYREAVKQGYIVPVEAYFITVPKTQPKGKTWPSIYSELVVNNLARNKILWDVLIKLSQQNVSTLCLVKEINHGKILSYDDAFSFVSGQNDQKHLIDLFCEGTVNTLIGTVGVLGEGTDTKPAEYIIISGLGKSKPQFMQMVGRGVRKYKGKESCKIIILKDLSHKWCANHFREQCKILKDEYGVIPLEILV